jgi:iron-sulfur cluster repair protein YtfE (RIC family)
MVDAACTRIKDLESQVRELEVACNTYRAQRDLLQSELDRLRMDHLSLLGQIMQPED